MSRARLRAAAAAAAGLVAGCGLVSGPVGRGLVSQDSPTFAGVEPSAVARLALRVATGGLTPLSALDGITQSTPLEAELPGAGPDGGSLSGIVALRPEHAGATAQAIPLSLPIQVGGGSVHLLTPEGYTYVRDGQPIAAPIDASGRFTYGSARIPRGLPVQEVAFLTHNMRLETFSIIQTGANSVTVTAASTYAGLYLQHQADLRGRAVTSFAPDSWQELVTMTDQALSDGELESDPADFDLDRGDQTTAKYQEMLGHDPALAAAWLSLLGPAPSPTPTPSYGPFTFTRVPPPPR